MDAKQLLTDNIKVYCLNKDEWEKNNLTLMPNGNFLDENGHINSKRSHIPYVKYDLAIEALELQKEEITERLRELCSKWDESYSMWLSVENNEEYEKEEQLKAFNYRGTIAAFNADLKDLIFNFTVKKD